MASRRPSCLTEGTRCNSAIPATPSSRGGGISEDRTEDTSILDRPLREQTGLWPHGGVIKETDTYVGLWHEACHASHFPITSDKYY